MRYNKISLWIICNKILFWIIHNKISSLIRCNKILGRSYDRPKKLNPKDLQGYRIYLYGFVMLFSHFWGVSLKASSIITMTTMDGERQSKSKKIPKGLSVSSVRESWDAEDGKDNEPTTPFQRSASLHLRGRSQQDNYINGIIIFLKQGSECGSNLFNQSKERQRRQPVGQVYEDSCHYNHSSKNERRQER